MLISYLESYLEILLLYEEYSFIAFDNFIRFGLVNMYLQAINYQYIQSSLKVIAIFKTDYGRTDTPY